MALPQVCLITRYNDEIGISFQLLPASPG